MVQKWERDEKQTIGHLPYFLGELMRNLLKFFEHLDFLTLEGLKILRGLGMYFNRFLSISTGK